MCEPHRYGVEAKDVIPSQVKSRTPLNDVLARRGECLLGELEAAGVQELIISFFPRTDPEQLRRFARECIG
jgi:hypothetical protein